MRLRWYFIIFIAILGVFFIPFSAGAKKKGVSLPPQITAYGGKTFTDFRDSAYTSYDLALRNYLIKRIGRRFNILLDPKTYSGFELLEIESFFKCKKSTEPFNLFLKMFPKQSKG